ncbi:hypothetical protein ABKA04_004404 [Annulohypoxylon sp. FPYF3050]
MRSHPYTPPPPLPPLLNDLSTYLPNSDRRDGVGGSEVGLADLDPETSRLLPEKRRQHRVRIQGRLAPVRSVSVANLRAPSPRDTTNRGLDNAVGGALPRRRRSEDDGGVRDGGGDVSEEEVEVGERDTQLRGSAYRCYRNFFKNVAIYYFILLKLRTQLRLHSHPLPFKIEPGLG